MPKEPSTQLDEQAPLAGVTRLKRWLRPVMVLVALVFMGGTAFQLAGQWDGRGVAHVWWLLALSVVPLITAAWVQAYGWVLLIDHLTGRRAPRGAAVMLYMDSQLARYTPGKVGLPVVRMAGARRVGVPPRTIGASILIELLSWMTTAIVIGFALLLASGMRGSELLTLVEGAAVFVVVPTLLVVFALVGVDRRRLPTWLRRVLDLEGSGPLMPWGLVLAHLGCWGLWAVHGYCVVRGLSGPEDAARATTGYFVLAPVVGFLTLVAPAGVGVREAVLSLGLAPVLGAPSAVAAGLASRIASLAADLCTWAVCRLLGRSRGWL